MDLTLRLTECLPLVSSLRSPVCEYITNFLRLTGQNISCIEHQKSRASIVVPYLHPQYLKHLGRCVYFVLFFFQNIDILYPLFNHLSRKILNYFLKCGVDCHHTPTGLPHTLVKVSESNRPLPCRCASVDTYLDWVLQYPD